jgi:hypothetical protein
MLKIGEKGGHLLATGRGRDWLEAVALVVIVEKGEKLVPIGRDAGWHGGYRYGRVWRKGGLIYNQQEETQAGIEVVTVVENGERGRTYCSTNAAVSPS